ncbi:hypothetical protein [Kurthia gibsonii]|uniref:hypothetical protein n=1 Tax=Kurthia gibsonii TaxID=33946 RepID=UPI002DB7DD92|nr:hypothetical protein [Kurthia gibsonii]MEB7772126.1 hypothetical protein [Kurthia gibsonii]
MYTVEKYLNTIKLNLDRKTNELVKAFENLKKECFSKDTVVLILSTSFSLESVNVFLSANEDMFNPVDLTDGYVDNIELIGEFTLYEKNVDLNEREKFSDFYENHDLEKRTINTYSMWIKECFDSANLDLSIPIYFGVLDEEYVLNLVTGEWEDPMEIEFCF